MKNRLFSKVLTFVLAVTMCIGNLSLGVFASENYLTTDKSEYTYGESVMVTATYEEEAYVAVFAKDDVVTVEEQATPYYWYAVNGADGVVSGVAFNIFDGNTTDRTDNLFLAVGEYKVVLLNANKEVVEQQEITVIEEVVEDETVVEDEVTVEEETVVEDETVVDEETIVDETVEEELVELMNVEPDLSLADVDGPQVVVSVDRSEIKISVNAVGKSGVAQLYRFNAEEYPSDDSMNGMSKFVSEKGIAVADYTCGTSTTVTLNRYDKDGFDNLYSKYYIIQDGKVLAGPYYASEISSLRNKQPFKVHTKKGLTLEDHTTINEAIEMGVSNTVINMDLCSLILANEDKNGNPIDNSNRGDVIEFESNGETFYFNADYVYSQDGLISAYTKAGMNVSLVLISWAKTYTEDYPSALLYMDAKENRQTMAFNTSTERGRDYWIAAMEFMANRYSQSSTLGIVNKFIVGNEIDYTYDWYLLQPNKDKNGDYQRVEFNIFMEEFARTLRLANLAVKKYNSGAKVVVSLTHNWATDCYDSYNNTGNSIRKNSYAPKHILDWISKYEKARGDYDWGIAVHPYPIGTTSSNPTKTDPSWSGKNGNPDPITGDWKTSPWITAANLELYQLYFEQPENKYNGTEMRTVSLTETSICNLDEDSVSADKYLTSVYEQAASVAQYYYRAAHIDCIDEIAYFQLHDQTGYKLGLLQDDGSKKPAYDVWKYVDTNKTFNYSQKYLKYITNGTWLDIMKCTKSGFNWDLMWDESKIMVRTIESKDVERTLKSDKDTYAGNEPILVTATGDIGDFVGLYKANDDILTTEAIYSYPVQGSNGSVKYRSGKTYDLIAFGEVSLFRNDEAALKAGDYKLVLTSGVDGSTVIKNIKITSDYKYGSTNLSLATNKTVYKTGEEIIVTASGNSKTWVGLYGKNDKYGSGNTTSIYWYYVNEPANGHLSGKPTILQTTIHNTDSSNPGTRIAPGEYIVYLFDGSNGNDYNVVESVEISVEGAAVDALTGITYILENDTDGFANGVVTVTKDIENDSATDCIMYWADENGKPLEGYTSLGKFKLNDTKTTHQMVSHTIIPAGAKKLIAYASDGASLSEKYVSVDLPANAAYAELGKPIVEFQMMSDVHVTTDAGATGDVAKSNEHFLMMLNDIKANSPESLGIFINGDIANTGSEAEFKKVYSMYYSVANTVDYFPEIHMSIGNHDWMKGNPDNQFQKYVKIFNRNLEKQPKTVYYDEEIGGYHFIYLGGEQNHLHAYLSATQLNWFDQRMAEITKEDPNKPVFVLLHQSLYNTVSGSLPGQGWNGVANESAFRRVLKKYGQIILFNGHSHWEMNSEANMFAGTTELPTTFNTASVGYLWSSYNVIGGEFEKGSHCYYIKVYEDKIVLLGRDVENNLFIPGAAYVVQGNEITTSKEVYNISQDQQTVNLEAKTSDNAELTYSSSDASIATVTQNGTILPKSTGTVTVTIMAQGNNTSVANRKYVTVNISEANVYRVFGNTRYETSMEIADAVVELNGSKVDSIIVASGTNFADALAGSYLAAKKNAPILMTDGKNGAAIRNYIRKNVTANGVVYILGGTAAVDDSVLSGLAGYKIKRLAGDNRYATNLEILKEAGVTNEEIIVATGTGFADSLSASASGKPILLVGKKLSEQQKAYLATVQTKQYYVVGGTSAVSTALENEVKTYGEVKRIGGSTRYQTSVMVAETFFNNATSAVVAYGRNFPDGLCGGPLAYAMEAPLILTENSKAADAVAFTTTRKIASGVVLGGAGLVSDNTTRKIFGLNNSASIVKK